MRTVTPHDEGPAGDQALAGRLFSPEGREDPYGVLRGSAQIGCRHALASQILHSPNFTPPPIGESDFEMFRMLSRWLIILNGERHRAMRRAFGGRFAPRQVEAYRATIQSTADQLIDAVLDQGAMDLVREFARPLPLAVICRVLGVPDERVAWIDEQMITLGQGFARQHEESFVRAASDAVSELQHYFRQLLHQRRQRPRDDLITSLALSLPSDPETRADVLANCVFFINAGHATTTSLIAAGVLLLLERPEQWQTLARNPDRIPQAVEEILRLITPVSVVVSRAEHEHEIDGHRFTAGERRIVFLSAANRDPTAFDHPDMFDPARAPNPHLAFSAGKHHCLGAPLARLHGEIAIRTLLHRIPDLRLSGKPHWRGSIPLRELESLPVTWSPGQHPSADRRRIGANLVDSGGVKH